MELLKTHTKGGPVHLVHVGGCCKLPFTAQAFAAFNSPSVQARAGTAVTPAE